MDFFRSQDIARRNTVRLVLLFLLSLVCLITITNVLVFFALGLASADAETPVAMTIDWRLFAVISVAVLAVVGFGSLYKVVSLSGGGARVAEMMQGRLLQPGSGTLAEQRLLNVVEEMAIASGTPVPPVYVMEEAAINAFAAGFAPGDAVIGITRGAIETLSRDELQGVIAHEFSHILHGDMRLNIRLIGILHGIMVLGIMGYYLLRSTALGSRRNNNGAQLAVLGIGLIVIGYAGTFFGNLIKAAVSRQREFLADASAVQYTRNPAGIANALKRIGGGPGSVLENPRTAEISHALFSNGMTFSLNSLFATHPPLETRIRRIQPDWDGSYELPLPEEPVSAAASAQASDRPLRSGGPVAAITTLAMMDALVARAGQPQDVDLQQARAVLASVPAPLLEAAHDPFGARAVIYLLLLDDDQEVAEDQLSRLRPVADAAVLVSVDTLRSLCAGLAIELRLPLATLCLPALRQLSAGQYTAFRDNVLVMMGADGRISLWEWVLQRVVLHSLDAVFMPHSDLHNLRHHTLRELAPEVANMLALMVRAGRSSSRHDREQEESTFRRAMTFLELQDVAMPASDDLSINSINVSLDALVALKIMHKQALLKACVLCIVADGVATAQELEIVRAIAVTLDCPLPQIPVQGTDGDLGESRQPDQARNG